MTIELHPTPQTPVLSQLSRSASPSSHTHISLLKTVKPWSFPLLQVGFELCVWVSKMVALFALWLMDANEASIIHWQVCSQQTQRYSPHDISPSWGTKENTAHRHNVAGCHLALAFASYPMEKHSSYLPPTFLYTPTPIWDCKIWLYNCWLQWQIFVAHSGYCK